MTIRIRSLSIDHTFGTAIIGVELLTTTGPIEEIRSLNINVNRIFESIEHPDVLATVEQILSENNITA